MAEVGQIYFLLANTASSTSVAAAAGPSAGLVRQVPDSRSLNIQRPLSDEERRYANGSHPAGVDPCWCRGGRARLAFPSTLIAQ